ncbi:MAG: inositol monophosphatase family protein [bacterium]|nr:inositol monophosphatase family protein [bacterium]
MDQAALKSALEFALDAAWQAGRITLRYYQTGIGVERKKDNSPVTDADRQAELALRDLITRHYPDHGIVGEEFGTQESRNGLYWTVDPIDGTKSFICGVPFYSNLLALVDETGRSVVGVVNLPALNEVVYAVRGMGCFWNGRRAQTSQVDHLENAVLLASDLVGYDDRKPRFERLIDSTYIQRTWGDAYGYTLVATGRADVIIDPKMWLWDCGPLQVILEEAGGTFTDWNGTPTIHAPEAVATNGALFDAVMAVTRSS